MQSLNYFQLAHKQDSEDETILLEWGVAHIHYAQDILDEEKLHLIYHEAEQKLKKAGSQGHQQAYYFLACLYSLLGRFKEAMFFISKANLAGVLPTIEDMITDDWLEPLRMTKSFELFIDQLESKQRNELP